MIIPDFLLKVWKVAGPFDHHTNQSRGFGFVVFNSEQAVGDLLRKGNMIHMSGSQDEIKRNIPKGSVQSDYFKTKKIFCLWNSTYMTDDEYQSFFSKHGKVLDHAIIRDPSTSQSRDFGFIGFDSIQIVDDLLAKGNMIDMAGSQVEIKKERLHEIKGFQNKEDFCCGIPLTMTEVEFKSFFSKYG
ncbi:heterogeneous nuclear ribonucleoprotein 1-like [Asparagus officinalis]|uniref:heterogeneous nuclear ribonucleoprotein 1-like n=1 Tax=Asparagus officinalis TaxID=4686 RepID=UPI00098E7F86|nr:heterogeneous nuclear ribonucleoprotein 1-like [Asparagus officinalis]